MDETRCEGNGSPVHTRRKSLPLDEDETAQVMLDSIPENFDQTVRDAVRV